ncbi:MAG: IS1595 family transposase [Proteobacteria bacterium]|nr:IS1595 family transposase [Pseudomonadota bacterium]
MSDLTNNPIFHNEAKARKCLESVRWPDGPYCPHCGEYEKVHKLRGKSHRPGLHQCNSCRKHFTVMVGTLYERSHVPLHKWLLATHLICASKKGMSSHQLHRMLGVTYKTAWFMSHRIREGMREGVLAPMGGPGSIVEVDETFIGHDHTIKPKGQLKGRGYHHKYKVLTLVERGGKARSMVVNELKTRTIAPLVRQNLAREARLMTDEAPYYTLVGREFAEHGVVHHVRGEYGRGEIHTNTIEGYFSIFKRGMKGVYQHCAKKHLHRYLSEFDFRYNYRQVSDAERTIATLKGIEGKRLTYRRTGQGEARQ